MSTHNIRFYGDEAILMSTHNICFFGELTKIIVQLSSNTLLICSSAQLHFSERKYPSKDNIISLELTSLASKSMCHHEDVLP